MKVKVFPAFRWICVFILSLDIFVWITTIIFGGKYGLNVFSWCLMVLFTIVMPVGLFIWNIFIMENFILFDEQGVSRIRFGKIIRHFNWDEIQTISTTSSDSFTGWLYISNEVKSFDYLAVGKMRMDKKVIYLHLSDKAKTALQMFIPEYLKDKIEKLQ